MKELPPEIIHQYYAKGSWSDYFVNILKEVSERASCLRRKVGAIAVADRRIIATGYNGTPSGIAHCEKVGCLRIEKHVPSGERHEICRAVHAEQNLIIQAAKFGVPLVDTDIYCTHLPCFICFKMLVNCNVRSIYFLEGYPDDMTLDMYASNIASLPSLIRLQPEESYGKMKNDD